MYFLVIEITSKKMTYEMWMAKYSECTRFGNHPYQNEAIIVMQKGDSPVDEIDFPIFYIQGQELLPLSETFPCKRHHNQLASL